MAYRLCGRRRHRLDVGEAHNPLHAWRKALKIPVKIPPSRVKINGQPIRSAQVYSVKGRLGADGVVVKLTIRNGKRDQRLELSSETPP
jgi:hypothetical protein